MQYSIIIKKEGKYYISENLDLGVFSQGESFEEALSNIKEATELYLENNQMDNTKKTNFNPILTTISI